MAGLSIADLPLPPREFRPDLARTQRGSFETEAAARGEDNERVRLLRIAASQAASPHNRAAALELARLLRFSGEGVPQTVASSRYMRDQRIRVGGALWRLATEWPPVAFTLIPRGLDVPGNELGNVHPRRLCEALRSDLNRVGATRQSGYLITFLDGEYELNSDTYRIHFHGLAAGSIVYFVRCLGQQTYRHLSRRHSGGGERPVQRVRVQSNLTDLPAPLTYVLKSFWSARWEGKINEQWVRQTLRSRIPEPRHSQLLLWLDKWRLQDLCLMMRLRVGKDGLQPTPKAYVNGIGHSAQGQLKGPADVSLSDFYASPTTTQRNR